MVFDIQKIGSALFRNVSKLRRTFRVRIPLQHSIRHHNMKMILDENLHQRKERAKFLTYHDPKHWNWFIHKSTTYNDRGLLFNIQMCRYLMNILQHNLDLKKIYHVQFFSEGFLFNNLYP